MISTTAASVTQPNSSVRKPSGMMRGCSRTVQLSPGTAVHAPAAFSHLEIQNPKRAQSLLPPIVLVAGELVLPLLRWYWWWLCCCWWWWWGLGVSATVSALTSFNPPHTQSLRAGTHGALPWSKGTRTTCNLKDAGAESLRDSQRTQVETGRGTDRERERERWEVNQHVKRVFSFTSLHWGSDYSFSAVKVLNLTCFFFLAGVTADIVEKKNENKGTRPRRRYHHPPLTLPHNRSRIIQSHLDRLPPTSSKRGHISPPAGANMPHPELGKGCLINLYEA